MADGMGRDEDLATDRKSRRVPVRATLAGVVTLAAGIFLLQNQDETHMEFLGFTGTVPLYAVIVISMVLGAVMGWLAGFIRRRRRRRSDRILSESG
ncbi:MAG: LapA family protein [Actinomycetota bacterium]|nr:LapA family protein [Actinomycetota bacterium]MDK1038938.1 LapA family protein [Actinomycetota bacterium]MDK1102774.1 LapA family protein [Actinomycetota bacterium]MDK1292265.1 LapA family protein [Actinomycetota bacterium]